MQILIKIARINDTSHHRCQQTQSKYVKSPITAATTFLVRNERRKPTTATVMKPKTSAFSNAEKNLSGQNKKRLVLENSFSIS